MPRAGNIFYILLVFKKKKEERKDGRKERREGGRKIGDHRANHCPGSKRICDSQLEMALNYAHPNHYQALSHQGLPMFPELPWVFSEAAEA